MPEISVIIPVYNRDGVISDAIGSVLAQTFKDYELIVVDDGSTDGSVEAISAFDDPRLVLCRHERNKGEPAARNTGIARARGRYVAFLDSDDLWQPAKLERQVAFMRAGQLSASFNWFSVEREPGKPAELRRTRQSRNWFRTLLFYNTLAPGSTIMVERVWYDRVGLYDESIPFGADNDWLLRFSRNADIMILPESLTLIRKVDQGIAGLIGGNSLARYHEKWTTPGAGRPRLTARELRRFRAGLEIGYAAISLRNGDRANIMRHLIHAATLTPFPVAGWCLDQMMSRLRSWLNRLHAGNITPPWKQS